MAQSLKDLVRKDEGLTRWEAESGESLDASGPQTSTAL
uniref:Uncharacterized protein n=1 Tax=Trichinella nativa TaxID=6335 RepID=A0A0V1ISE1_9BILA